MSRLAAVSFLVLSLSASALSPTTYGLAFRVSHVEVGGTARLQMTAEAGPQTGAQAFVFLGTAVGTSVVNVAGRDVTIPLGAGHWLGARTSVSNALGGFDASIMNDPSLAGQTLSVVAVVVMPDGSFFVTARTGGPIIQDAIA
jgi:hypothetical protein